MTIDNEKLQALRQEIDSIDDSLHDLIMERTKIVERVREAKKGEGIKIRPAREAEILYRLIARHRGPFPKPELARIWRELIVATLRFEGPFSVAVFVPEADTAYLQLARDQYGTFTPMMRHGTCRGVVEAVRTGEATVGILPFPERDDTENWWRLMVSVAPETPRVIARLPFITAGGKAGAGPEALAVCPIGQEATGRDRSYLAVEAEEDIGAATIEAALGEVGFTVAFSCLWHEPERPAAWTYLVEVFGFIDAEGRQFPMLLECLGKRAKRVLHLGGYATPLGEADMTPAGGDPKGGGTS